MMSLVEMLDVVKMSFFGSAGFDQLGERQRDFELGQPAWDSTLGTAREGAAIASDGVQCVCVCVYVCACVCAYVCVCACMCVCMCVC